MSASHPELNPWDEKGEEKDSITILFAHIIFLGCSK